VLRTGTTGATKLFEDVGNTQLVFHGIQNENSHTRAHVCPVAQRVYVFKTAAALDLIEKGHYPKRNGYQKGVDVPTAIGYLVPPMDIPGCVALCLRLSVWQHLCFSEDDSLYEKGRKATKLVLQMVRQGLFPLPALGEEITDENLQIDGEDIIIKANAFRFDDLVIQVKCDYPGGERELGGTGNLYLQIAECNPFSIH